MAENLWRLSFHVLKFIVKTIVKFTQFIFIIQYLFRLNCEDNTIFFCLEEFWECFASHYNVLFLLILKALNCAAFYSSPFHHGGLRTHR